MLQVHSQLRAVEPFQPHKMQQFLGNIAGLGLGFSAFLAFNIQTEERKGLGRAENIA